MRSATLCHITKRSFVEEIKLKTDCQMLLLWRRLLEVCGDGYGKVRSEGGGEVCFFFL